MKWLGRLLILAIFGGVGYACYYFYQNPDAYQVFEAKVNEKFTGQTAAVEVADFEDIRIQMDRSLSGERYISGNDILGEDVAYNYVKSVGGDLYLPIRWEYEETALWKPAGQEDVDITSEVTYNWDLREVMVSESFLQEQAEGEYCLYMKDKYDGSYRCYPILIQETAKVNSTNYGAITYGDNMGNVLFHVGQPEDIVIKFYNLGDNVIKDLWQKENIAVAVDREGYDISESGNVLTLKKEYLLETKPVDKKIYEIGFANGETFVLEEMPIWIVRKDGLKFPEIQVEPVYSKSAGGDFRIKLSYDDYIKVADHVLAKNEGEWIWIFEEQTEYFNADKTEAILPEAFMQSLEPGYYDYALDFFVYDSEFTHEIISFEVVE